MPSASSYEPRPLVPVIKLIGLFNWLGAVQMLFGINVVVWLAFGVVGIIRLADIMPGQIVVWVIAGAVMFGNVGAMVAAAVLLSRRRFVFYLFALAVVLVNVLAAFMDQLGPADFLAMVPNLLILSILVGKRRLFLRPTVVDS